MKKLLLNSALVAVGFVLIRRLKLRVHLVRASKQLMFL